MCLSPLLQKLNFHVYSIVDRGNDNWLIKYDGGEIVEPSQSDPTEVGKACNHISRLVIYSQSSHDC